MNSPEWDASPLAAVVWGEWNPAIAAVRSASRRGVPMPSKLTRKEVLLRVLSLPPAQGRRLANIEAARRGLNLPSPLKAKTPKG